MKKLVYTLRDRKSSLYGTIFLDVNDDTARRTVTEARIPYKNDLELYQLGTYDDENGKIDVLNAPRFIMNLEEIL